MKDYIRQNKTCRRRLRSIIWHFIDLAINRIINKIMSTHWNDRCRLVVEQKWRIKSVPQLWFWIPPEVLATFCFPGCFHVCQWTCHTTQAEQAEKCSYFPLCAVAPAETCLGVCVCVCVCVCMCVCVCVCVRACVPLSVCAFKHTLTHIRLVSSMTSNLSEQRRWFYETGCCIFSL